MNRKIDTESVAIDLLKQDTATITYELRSGGVMIFVNEEQHPVDYLLFLSLRDSGKITLKEKLCNYHPVLLPSHQFPVFVYTLNEGT